MRMIQMALDLTPAEAREAVELRRSGNVESVAIALAVAPSTERTYLKHVYEKTGMRKQSELMASVARAPRNTGAAPSLPYP